MSDNKPENESLGQSEIVDLGTFINRLTDWHQSKLAFLQHLRNVPEGICISIDGGADIELSGDLLKGYQLGLSMAISELGIFPISKGIVTEIESPDASEEKENVTVH